MSSSSSLGILMTQFPGLEVISETQKYFGVGYILGPIIGGIGASIGGFTVPFLVVGGFNIIASIVLIFIFLKLAEAEPAQVEPIQAEPAQAEPAQAEPAQSEPAQTEHHETEQKLRYFNSILKF